MIGKGNFRFMTRDITGPFTLQVGQERFNDQLKRRTGCELVWHRQRRIFWVCRLFGENQYPILYAELTGQHFPLNDGVLSIVMDTIAMRDAKMNQDFAKEMDICLRRQKEQDDEETNAFIHERFPDFWHDYTRWCQIIDDGRYSSPYFDMGVDSLPN